MPNRTPYLLHAHCWRTAGAQGRQIVLEMTMGLENRPEYIGNGEDNANKRYIRQGDPLLTLPKQCPSVSAAWAAF